jgi:hypothetical protein
MHIVGIVFFFWFETQPTQLGLIDNSLTTDALFEGV